MQAEVETLLRASSIFEFVAGLMVGGVGMRLLLRAFSPSEGRRLRGAPRREPPTRTRATSGGAGQLLGAVGKGLLAAVVEANRRSMERRGVGSGRARDAQAELARLMGAVNTVTGQASAGAKGAPGGFVDAEAKRLLARGDVMAAIAFVRQATGMGLAEAKEYVTRLRR
ncbi:MAG: hypothetical protein HYX65_10585 [Gemmatimonadetes bacterium]|nr:hypothetical protein [Gemmatimonadota bacterium]